MVFQLRLPKARLTPNAIFIRVLAAIRTYYIFCCIPSLPLSSSTYTYTTHTTSVFASGAQCGFLPVCQWTVEQHCWIAWMWVSCLGGMHISSLWTQFSSINYPMLCLTAFHPFFFVLLLLLLLPLLLLSCSPRPMFLTRASTTNNVDEPVSNPNSNCPYPPRTCLTPFYASTTPHTYEWTVCFLLLFLFIFFAIAVAVASSSSTICVCEVKSEEQICTTERTKDFLNDEMMMLTQELWTREKKYKIK